jgi:hypothetical protein
MKKLSELVEVAYGTKLDLNKLHLRPLSEGGVNFVGRSSKNSGVTATVSRLENISPYEEGLITVALGGSKLLASFVQQSVFYTAQNVAILRPRQEMSFNEKVFLCLCIRQNRFRYSAFGREANRSLGTLLVPEPAEFPRISVGESVNISYIAAPLHTQSAIGALKTGSWASFRFSDLFKIRKGKRLTKADMCPGSTPFIGAVDGNNGLTSMIDQRPIHQGGTITVSYNGSVGEAFFQEQPFWCSDDVNVLYPKFKINRQRALFLITLIRRERYRFSYGRKWNLERMEKSTLHLPVARDGRPDWLLIERCISGLPFSSQLR